MQKNAKAVSLATFGQDGNLLTPKPCVFFGK
jgi:hypothetical protein